MAKQILRRKWGWIGHTLRKPATSTTHQEKEEKETGLTTVGDETLKQS